MASFCAASIAVAILIANSSVMFTSDNTYLYLFTFQSANKSVSDRVVESSPKFTVLAQFTKRGQAILHGLSFLLTSLVKTKSFSQFMLVSLEMLDLSTICTYGLTGTFFPSAMSLHTTYYWYCSSLSLCASQSSILWSKVSILPIVPPLTGIGGASAIFDRFCWESAFVCVDYVVTYRKYFHSLFSVFHLSHSLLGVSAGTWSVSDSYSHCFWVQSTYSRRQCCVLRDRKDNEAIQFVFKTLPLLPFDTGELQ